jgi:hypothetical protein
MGGEETAETVMEELAGRAVSQIGIIRTVPTSATTLIILLLAALTTSTKTRIKSSTGS